MVCVVSPQVLSQHMGRLFQSPKVIEGLVGILLRGQPALKVSGLVFTAHTVKHYYTLWNNEMG